jgi:hypothetical protein
MMLALQQEREQRRLQQQQQQLQAQSPQAAAVPSVMGVRPAVAPPPPMRSISAIPVGTTPSTDNSSTPTPPPNSGRVPSILTHSFDDIPAGTDLYHQLRM